VWFLSRGIDRPLWSDGNGRRRADAAGKPCKILGKSDVKPILKKLLWLVGALVVLSAALMLWFKGLAKDDGGAGRPTYGLYAWQQAESPGSAASAALVDDDPNAQPQRATPRGGPKLRTGYYTTDPDDHGLENQIPDIGNTFSTAWFKIPAGARIVMKGEFPHMRHWSFVTYT
jgi:hypothetical protein